jgi:hypothetical protein
MNKAKALAAPKTLRKSCTGIRGLDEITGGGLPAGRPTLVCGAAGCGKTLLAMEFLVRGATQYDEPGVFMAFEETRERGGTRWLRFQEKRGKEHEVPVHSKAKEAVDLWLERSSLASNPSAPLFPSFGKNRETIESRRLDRRSVLKLVEQRAKASGILKRVCCHSFRATGVTEYMNSGGTIEIAQRIAGHTSPSTTRIYDRSRDRLTLEEIERVQIGKKQEI